MSQSDSDNHGGCRWSGFTLIEILIAFAIMTMAMGTLMQTFSTGMRGLRASENHETALMHVRSMLEEVGVTFPLEEGEAHGRFDRDFGWTLRVFPVLGMSGEGTGSMIAYQIEAKVSWTDGNEVRSVAMTTVRAAPGSL